MSSQCPPCNLLLWRDPQRLLNHKSEHSPASATKAVKAMANDSQHEHSAQAGALSCNLPKGTWMNPDDRRTGHAHAWDFLVSAWTTMWRGLSQAYFSRGYLEEVNAGNANTGARVKSDQQCMTTEDSYENHDLYYLRGGPGFGDPLDREIEAIANDLKNSLLLPEYAQKVYGVVATRDAQGVWTVDAKQTALARIAIRRQRLARSIPTQEWMKLEREHVLAKNASPQVQHMFATSFGLSRKFEQQFRDFWNLPDSWVLTEDELDVPTYGSKFRMDLSKMPDVKTVVLVEE
jgi:hypothetical protein